MDPTVRGRTGGLATAKISRAKRDAKIDELGITKEELEKRFIEKNLTLEQLAESFGVSISWIRKRLYEFDVKKDQKEAVKNSKTTFIERYGENAYRMRGFANDKEAQRKAKINAAASRKRNRLERLAEEGITEESLRELYLELNLSITEVGARFGRSKAQMRKLLSTFSITKSKEKIDEARARGFKEFHADPERIEPYLSRVAQTTSKRYGNNWYRNTISKEEEGLLEAVRALFPDEEILSGDYSTLRRPGRGNALQLDILIPNLKVAIEYNGLYYHDREAYLKDLNDGAETTREALKDRLCEERGLRLFHVWSDEWKDSPEGVLEKIRELVL